MKVYCVFRRYMEYGVFKGSDILLNIFKDKNIADSMAAGFNADKKEGVKYYVQEREVY